MHTTQANSTVFLHNGDFSGDVEIESHTGERITIPFDDVKLFVSEYVRLQRISVLEQMTDDEVLFHAQHAISR